MPNPGLNSSYSANLPSGAPSPIPSVNDLLASANAQGDLSDEVFDTLSVADVGAQIQAAMGVSAFDVPASRVVLLGFVLDDSGSIHSGGNEQVVRDGYNTVVEALRASHHADDVVATCSMLNRGLTYPYQPLASVPLLDRSNYSASGGTPLYDRTHVALGLVLTKTLEFEASAIPVRSITLLVTDGADYGSHRSARDVAPLVREMLGKESHIIAAMGIDDGSTDFRAVFREMGIEDNWIMTPKNSAKDIRDHFQLFSRSAVSASQNQTTFSQTAQSGVSVGGFGG